MFLTQKRILKVLNSFVFFCLTIFSITLVIFLINNFSNNPAKHMLQYTKANAIVVSEFLTDIENSFVFDSMVISELYAELNKTTYTESQRTHELIRTINVILKNFVAKRPESIGYFYYIQTKEDSVQNTQIYYDSQTNEKKHISVLLEEQKINGTYGLNNHFQQSSDPVLQAIHNPYNDIIYLAFIVPIIDNGQYVGLIGTTLDLQHLSQKVNSLTDSRSLTYLLSNNAEILIHPQYSTGVRYDIIQNGKNKAFIQQVLLDKTQNGMYEGYQKFRENNQSFIRTHYFLPTGQIYVEEYNLSTWMRKSNILIWSIALFAVLTVLLVHSTRKDKLTSFDILANHLMKNHPFGRNELNRNRAALGLFLGMIGAFLAYIFYIGVNGFDVKRFVVYSLFTILTLVMLVYYRSPKSTKWIPTFFIALTMLCPLLIHLGFGGFSSNNTGEIIMWIMISVLISLFLVGRDLAQLLIKAFVFLLFFDVLIEINVFSNEDYTKIFTFITGLFFLGFSLYTSIEIYVTRSAEEHATTENLLLQLKEAQSNVIQREKMVTLGRLIAGIAHEINTPIGAIKASAETLDSSFSTMIRNLAFQSRDMTEEDFEHLIQLIHLSEKEMGEMHSTLEVRRAKPKMLALLEENKVENAQEIVSKLARMEIINLDKIQELLSIFQSPNSTRLVTMLCDLSPYITSTQAILIGAEKVSKNIFALKSYSRTNLTNEATEYDIIKNIENVLFLYNNILKQGVTVIREYDEPSPRVFGSPDELSQVWTNIIHNAIYAMDGRGELTITVKQLSESVSVCIKDSGCGIAEKDLQNVFEPFYSTKPIGEGSGLGLDICKKIISGHNGTIELFSELTVGTIVKITLPTQ